MSSALAPGISALSNKLPTCCQIDIIPLGFRGKKSIEIRFIDWSLYQIPLQKPYLKSSNYIMDDMNVKSKQARDQL